ncbi:hypothetical protein HFN63_36165 [Rhizobium leguminosarum]|uniref:hypothetical protein n=1 Tax=Rhizobium leguminosarum TaxID=384 RepID=UPI001C9790D0|nr:hypothetical protein [Rhizobium leguminosarum]MBY5775367.1 hypothetical protein [Rhizobium leguminosarum]
MCPSSTSMTHKLGKAPAASARDDMDAGRAGNFKQHCTGLEARDSQVLDDCQEQRRRRSTDATTSIPCFFI